jgi:hypothetical protein
VSFPVLPTLPGAERAASQDTALRACKESSRTVLQVNDLGCAIRLEGSGQDLMV